MRADNFRAELPAGYAEAYHINAGSGWQAAAFTAASVAMAALIIAPVLACTDILKRAYAAGAAALLCMVLVGVICLVAYLILHELVHGAAYKLLTGSKLTFGITLTVAFCGVPDIYVTRRTALISLLAPFTLFGALFAGFTAWLYFASPLYCTAAVVLLGLHFGGCVGDLYTAALLIFRLRDSRLLMRDTGPEQFFYLPAEGAGQ